ncbi:MAG: hypothetical protein ACOCQH_00475 [Halanaerobiales bacterium]
MNKKYLALISRIEEEISEIDKLTKKIIEAWGQAQKNNDSYYLDSVALNLHGFYSAIERIFELIARDIDENFPRGSSWHRDLLIQMKTEIKKVRPAVISRSTYQQLDEYRGFRHVVRNVYTFNLSEKRIQPLVDDLQETYSGLKEELEVFINFIETAAD